MSVLESIHPSIPASGIIVDPTFAATVGDRQSIALAHTAYEVLTTPLGQKVLRAVELNKDESDDDKRYEGIHKYLGDNGVNLEPHTEDAMTALAALFVNGTVSVQVDRGIVGANSPAVESRPLSIVEADEQIYDIGNTANPADEQQKNDDGSVKTTPEKPKKRDA